MNNQKELKKFNTRIDLLNDAIATHNGFILTDQGFVLAKLNKNVVL